MRLHYFDFNQAVHVLNPHTHQLFKRVGSRWIELRHPSEFECFRLKAVELPLSAVPSFDPGRLPSERAPGGAE